MAAELPYAIFRQEKINNYADFSQALGHANRQWDVPNADNEVENEYLVSTPLENIKERCEKARTRSDNVLGYDLLFTASPEFFAGDFTGKKFNRWKDQTIQWIEENYGGKENIVNLTVHLDETTPHISCQTVAIYQGKLNAKHFTGGTRNRMSELQDSYAASVSHLGLKRGERGSLATHETIKKYYARANEDEANALDQPRKLKDLGLQKEKPQNGLITKEDPEKYLQRTFDKYIAPKIQELLDENCRLRSEIVALKREVKHWRSARSWTKQNAENLQKLKTKYQEINFANRKLKETLQEVEEIAPGIVKKLRRERGERNR